MGNKVILQTQTLYRRILHVAAICSWLNCTGQSLVTPLQTFSSGGATGAVFSSTTVPTYFASIGQPMVYTRSVSTNNGGGVMNANELMFSSSDLTAPIVSDNTSPTVSSASNITITANITDNESSVTAATVNYRSIAAGGALTTKTLSANGNSFSFQITPAEIGELGIEYKISATSSGGTYTDTNFKTVRVTVTGSGLQIPYASFGSDVSNYRIVAVPLVTSSSNTVNDVFGDDLGAYGDKTQWRMYRYDNGVTTELSGSTPIDPGKGYWLIVRSNATINTGAGTSVQTSSDAPFQIDLKADWNEIGNPYDFNLSWADVQAANPNLPGLRIYNGGFNDGTRLKAFEGGFIKVNAAQKLIFPVLKNTSVQGGRGGAETNVMTNAIDHSNWRVKFDITEGFLQNHISGFGMDQDASLGFDRFDGFNLPSFFETYLNLNHHKKDGSDFYSTDIVPTADEHTWEFSIESSSSELVVMRWDNSYFGNGNRELYLWHESTQRSIDMRSSNAYEFQKTDHNLFKVFYGSTDFVKENTKVPGLVVHALWPNPAMEDITISFSLPENTSANQVTITMTDLMGRKIWSRELLLSSGYHEAKWSRTNVELSGVYFVSVTDGATTVQRKLVLK